MKLSTQVINVFEKLATNTHHNVDKNALIENQPQAVKEILSLKESTDVRDQFSKTGYFSDSVKVTEI